jgi:2-haloacid dehalogenase
MWAEQRREDQPMAYAAYVFDAYGTLFDVHSAVTRHADLVGPSAARVSEVWRAKQLEYSWTRSGMGRYRDFWTLTAEALDFALSSVPDANREARQKLLDAYESLDCFAEVPAVLTTLKAQGARLAILSNGSPDMLDSAVQSAGLGAVLDDVFSVHPLQVFKTAPKTYAMVTDAYGIEPAAVSFQSSNRWDVAGATAFGFQCRWINRTGQPDEYGDLQPVEVLKDLNGLITSPA